MGWEVEIKREGEQRDRDWLDIDTYRAHTVCNVPAQQPVDVIADRLKHLAPIWLRIVSCPQRYVLTLPVWVPDICSWVFVPTVEPHSSSSGSSSIFSPPQPARRLMLTAQTQMRGN